MVDKIECSMAEQAKNPDDFWSCVYRADDKIQYYQTVMKDHIDKRAYYLSQGGLDHQQSYDRALKVHSILCHQPLGIGHYYKDKVNDNLDDEDSKEAEKCHGHCNNNSSYVKVSSKHREPLCYDCLLTDFTQTPMSHWSRYYS